MNYILFLLQKILAEHALYLFHYMYCSYLHVHLLKHQNLDNHHILQLLLQVFLFECLKKLLLSLHQDHIVNLHLYFVFLEIRLP